MLLNLNYEFMNVKEKKQLQDLTEKYKAKGIIKKYDKMYTRKDFGDIYKDFEWT